MYREYSGNTLRILFAPLSSFFLDGKGGGGDEREGNEKWEENLLG